MKFSIATSFLLAMRASISSAGTLWTKESYDPIWQTYADYAVNLSVMSYFAGDGFDASKFNGPVPQRIGRCSFSCFFVVDIVT